MRTFKEAHTREVGGRRKREGRLWKVLRVPKMKVGMCCREKGYGVSVEKYTHVVKAECLKRS